jgi:alpha-mannosidase
MKYSELIILLPCHSLEDFPVYQEGEQAEGLLSAWSALWHPALLVAAERLPTWFRADSPPEELAGRLVVVPQASEALLLAGWTSRAQAAGAHVVRKTHRRDEVLAAALAELDGGAGGVEPELAADFQALGFCYLMVELLTRQMRYMSNVDEIHLKNETLAAARAAMGGEAETARDRLRACFDLLTEARERFYPVESYLVDLVLTAPTTLGAGLRRELDDPVAKNVLICGQSLEQLAASQPETLSAFQLALDHGRVAVVGGEYCEGELPLLPIEAVLAELRRGAASYQASISLKPVVYGRRRFGLSPLLPMVLSRLGYEGALHLTLDDGRFPRTGQAKSRWEGLDASAIDALERLPLDANLPESFLGFPRKMGEAMDLDHVATVVFAHWPGQVSPFFSDLRRSAAYAPVLGKFITLTDYFRHTTRPGELTKFKADLYRAPYLRQAIIREEVDPLSHLLRHHQRRAQAEAIKTLDALAELIGGQRQASASTSCGGTLMGEIDAAAAGASPELDQRIASGRLAAASELAEALARSAARRRPGLLVLNPQSFARRVLVDVSALPSLPDCEGPIAAVQESQSGKQAVVDVPAMGFAWIGPGAGAPEPAPTKRRSKPVVEDPTIRNELLEVVMHPETGGIRAIREIGQRGNRMSQQLALRLPAAKPKPGDVWRDPDLDAAYSVMAADAVEVTASGPAWSEAVSRGRLLDLEGRRLAGYEQRIRLSKGSRVVELEIELDMAEGLRADPWNSYYAARFAWGDEDAPLWRSVGMTSQLTEAKHVEAPHFVEIRSEKGRAAVLAGGLPYHRRVGPRMLDTLLVVRGETERRFRLGIGVGLAQPIAAAMESLDPAMVVPEAAQPASGSTGWLFHIDAKNILATHWETLVEEGVVAGFRMRMLETAGRAGRVQLRAFRPLASARQTDYLGQTLAELTVEEDRIHVDVSANEWVELEARWRP